MKQAFIKLSVICIYKYLVDRAFYRSRGTQQFHNVDLANEHITNFWQIGVDKVNGFIILTSDTTNEHNVITKTLRLTYKNKRCYVYITLILLLPVWTQSMHVGYFFFWSRNVISTLICELYNLHLHVWQ